MPKFGPLLSFVSLETMTQKRWQKENGDQKNPNRFGKEEEMKR